MNDGTGVKCPKCESLNVMLVEETYVCMNCRHTFKIDMEFVPRRIFISYGHDEYAALAEKLRTDLEARGHDVVL